MDLTRIKQDMPVYAEGPGGLAGASDVHIGNVDKIESDKYIKLAKFNSPDGEAHWFPVEWIRAIDESAIFLNKTVDQVASELVMQPPINSQ